MRSPARKISVESAATSMDWNREFHRRDAVASCSIPEAIARSHREEEDQGRVDPPIFRKKQWLLHAPGDRQPSPSPGTLEEETIDEEEADAVHYETIVR